MEQLQKLQWQDEKLYSFFKVKLEAQIQAFGVQKMAESVKELERLNDLLRETCVLAETDKKGSGNTKFAPWSPDVVSYLVHTEIEECRLAAYSENNLIDFMRKKQYNRWMDRS